MSEPEHKHTENELQVLRALSVAWDAFLTLPVQHPDDRDDFRRSIHASQDLIAIRLARRVDPVTWPSKQ